MSDPDSFELLLLALLLGVGAVAGVVFAHWMHIKPPSGIVSRPDPRSEERNKRVAIGVVSVLGTAFVLFDAWLHTNQPRGTGEWLGRAAWNVVRLVVGCGWTFALVRFFSDGRTDESATPPDTR